MIEYLPVILTLAVAALIPAGGLIISRLLFQTRKYDKVKLEPYECGIKPEASARSRFSIRFYIIAILFVVFDVETIFLFPWAILYDQLMLFGLIEMGLFLGILFLGYWYAWEKKALEWA